jgi:hypothetical protein
MAMAFAQFTYRESLRDIEACLQSMSGKLYHMGLRCRIARSTSADTNESHDCLNTTEHLTPQLTGIAKRAVFAPPLCHRGQPLGSPLLAQPASEPLLLPAPLQKLSSLRAYPSSPEGTLITASVSTMFFALRLGGKTLNHGSNSYG